MHFLLTISNTNVVLSVYRALFLHILHMSYGLNLSLPIEDLTPNVIVFGERVFFKEYF